MGGIPEACGFSLIGLAGVGLSTGSIAWAALLLLGAAVYYAFVVEVC